MKRVYASTADFRAPFDSAVLSGMGAVSRHYMDVANFRAGYDNGYFQDNSLFGLGAVPPAAITQTSALPVAFRRYVETGVPMASWRRDLGAATNQVPRWAWGLIAVGALALAYRSWPKKSAAAKE